MDSTVILILEPGIARKKYLKRLEYLALVKEHLAGRSLARVRNWLLFTLFTSMISGIISCTVCIDLDKK